VHLKKAGAEGDVTIKSGGEEILKKDKASPEKTKGEGDNVGVRRAARQVARVIRGTKRGQTCRGDWVKKKYIFNNERWDRRGGWTKPSTGEKP